LFAFLGSTDLSLILSVSDMTTDYAKILSSLSYGV